MLSLLTVALTHGALAAVLDLARPRIVRRKVLYPNAGPFPTENRTYQQRYLYSGRIETAKARGTWLHRAYSDLTATKGLSMFGRRWVHDRRARPKWGALVFPEERYFGKSLPFGAASFKPENAKFHDGTGARRLCGHSRRAQVDLPGARDCQPNDLWRFIRQDTDDISRASYPYAVVGGLAASAPISYYAHSWAAHGVDEFMVRHVPRSTSRSHLAIQKAA